MKSFFAKSGFAGTAVLTALFFLPSVAVGAPSPLKKYKVCSVTINSSEEIEAFKEWLPEEHFEFTEIVPPETNEPAPHETDRWFGGEWFEPLCERISSAVRQEAAAPCDIVVVSAEFGGRFTGKSEYALPLTELERMACSRKCAWLLSAPREVFLFSCNVLAEKEADSRKPEEYIQVLLSHNYSRLEAERAAAIRYSPLASSFKQRMRFIFASPEERAFIYGFDSKSPYGRNIKHMVEHYLQTAGREEGGYQRHLDALDESRFPNPFWSRSLRVTNQTQTLSANYEDPEHRIYQKFCGLYDKDRSDRENMALALSLLREEGGGAYFEHVSRFLKKDGPWKGEAAQLFEEAQNDGALARRYTEKYLEEKNWLERFPILRAERLLFLLRMKWIPPEFYQSETGAVVRSVALSGARNAYGNLNLLVRMDADIVQNAALTAEDFSDEWFTDPGRLGLFGLLRPSDPDIQRQIAGALENEDPAVRLAGLEALGQIRIQDPEIQRKMTEPLEDEDPNVRIQALWALGRLAGPADPEIQRKTAERLDDEDLKVQLEAFRVLEKMRPSDPEIQSKAETFVEHENPDLQKAAESFLNAL